MIELRPNAFEDRNCHHMVHRNFIGRMDQKIAEQKTRELSLFSKEALQKSYDSVNELRKINHNRRNQVVELESKLLNLCLKASLESKPRNENLNNRGKLRFPFFVAHSKSSADLERRRASWTKPSIFLSSSALRVKTTKSNRTFRQSIIRRPPSDLQVCLRNQLITMKQEKCAIIEDLRLKRKQKQTAIDTLMRTIEIHSKNLQSLLQQKQEMGQRHSNLSEETIRYNELQERAKELESRVLKKLSDVHVMRITLANPISSIIVHQDHE